MIQYEDFMTKYVLNSFLAGFFSVMFSISPYAMASEKPNDQAKLALVKKRIKDLKLETTKSFPELFARFAANNKSVNPVIVAQVSKTFQDEKYPRTEVQEFKYKGKDALKVINEVNGEQVVVEYLYNGDEVMKINGTLFTKADAANMNTFNAKLKTVPVYRKIYKNFRNKILQTNTTPTFEQWKRLTIAQRIVYRMHFREMLEAAYKVHNTPRFKVVSNKSFDQWVYEIMAGEDAQADALTQAEENAKIGVKDVAPPPGNSSTAGAAKQQADAKKAKSLSETVGYNQDTFRGDGEEGGPSCIVAGYAREWKSDGTCPWNGGDAKGSKAFYEKFPTSKTCLDPSPSGYQGKPDGGTGWIACNPLLYGFRDDGRPHCINTSIKTGTTENFNFATHGNGPCEARSPLSTADDKMKFIQNILKKAGIDDETQKKLKKRTKNGAEELYTDDQALYDKIFNELQSPLNKYIDSAKKICQGVGPENNGKYNSYTYNKINMPPKGVPGPKQDKAFQDQACDGLMKRVIDVKNLLKTSADSPAIAGACKGWMPIKGVVEKEVNGKKECACINPKATAYPNAQICIIADGNTQPKAETAPVAKEAEEPVVDAGMGLKVPEKDCTAWWSRVSSSECTAGAMDYFGPLLIGVGVACLYTYVAETGNFCSSDDDDNSEPKYTDPVAPCPPTGCPDTPKPPVIVPPPEPPRNVEGTTNQKPPVYDFNVIPPASVR